MKVIITGGGGFLGMQLARRLIESPLLTGSSGRSERIDEITLFDLSIPSAPVTDLGIRMAFVAGDISDADMVRSLIDHPNVSIFHLASIVSGSGEVDFDLAMRVNLEGNLCVLEAARASRSRPRIVFASSIAVFGGAPNRKRVGDDTKQVPQTTYGMTKAIGELLINDYSRKGYIDGRSARLPTVIIRPGRPNNAASSFASGIFREPLNGIDCVLPVTLDTVMPIAGYRTVVDGLVRLHEIDGDALGADRAVSLPSLDLSVAEMIAGLTRVAGDRRLGRIRVERNPEIERIVATWPTDWAFDRAISLGLPRDPNLDSIVRGYIQDFLA